MRHLLALVVAVGLAAVTLGAQTNSLVEAALQYGATPNWQVPRTPDGRPDLQGVWGHNAVTPMQRPRQWADKTELTQAEVQELKAVVAKFVDQGGDAIFGSFVQLALDARERGQFNQTSYDRTTGNYNQFWMADR